jgi:hypothetical protein
MKCSYLAHIILSLFLSENVALGRPDRSESVSYDKAKVLRINLDSTLHQAEIVKDLVRRRELLTWTPDISPGNQVDVVVSPEKIEAFKMEINGIEFEIIHHDLGKSIQDESKNVEPESGM